MPVDKMNQRFRVIEDMWKVGSEEERDEYVVELREMKAELAKVTGPQGDGAKWLGRTVDRLLRNISERRVIRTQQVAAGPNVAIARHDHRVPAEEASAVRRH